MMRGIRKLLIPLLSVLTSCSALVISAPPVINHLISRQSQDPAIVDIPSPVSHTGNVDACQGYQLSNITSLTSSNGSQSTGLNGILSIIGNCSAYGPDYPTLRLTVRYETANRLRVRIVDIENKAHLVPNDVAPWPEADKVGISNSTSNLSFQYTANPFTFKIVRKGNNEVIWDTDGQKLIFEQQFLRFGSKLASGSNIQGLGQHNENFTLPITQNDYVRTLWTRDAYGVPPYTNLYGAHPIYVNQRTGSSDSAHGIFLLNSQGMDIRFPNNGQAIEYSTLGGVIDLSFLNGPSAIEVAKQASDIWGRQNQVPYWSLGFHNCKYGYEDIFEVAEVIANYSAAGIPLQTQWMDIDYMYERWIQTLDPDRFSLEKVQYVIKYLHDHSQNFIVMVDPAVFSGTPNSSVANYETYQSGVNQSVFLKQTNGELYQGVVWPGPTVFPDWTAGNTQGWWNEQFKSFFSKENGVNVDGIWLDMNEPANFLPYLEANIYRISNERQSPPLRPLPRTVPRSISQFPSFTAGQNISVPFANSSTSSRSKRDLMHHLSSRQSQSTNLSDGDPSLNNQWLYPPYRIQDRRAPPSAGSSSTSSSSGLKNISDFSARTDLIQANGARTYDEHNLYGSRHAIATKNALLKRTPGERSFTIARSSFSGTPSGLWLGDNLSTWTEYIQTIRQMLQFGGIYGVGMVGADTCGFGSNTTETLCARWAWLGAMSPFFRNHNEAGNRPQEFYRWRTTTIAARAAIKTRLRLLDYIYSALHKQFTDGTPMLYALSWLHLTDSNTIKNDQQYYLGSSLLVSPVRDENSTSVDIYIPSTTYYDFFTLKSVQGNGSYVTLNNVGYDTMPLHIRGGSILALRSGNSSTTYDNQKLPFEIVIAPNSTNQAEGYLRLDDGISIDNGNQYSDIYMTFKDSELKISGTFGWNQGNIIDSIVFAGQSSQKSLIVNGSSYNKTTYDGGVQTVTASGLSTPFGEMSVKLQ